MPSELPNLLPSEQPVAITPEASDMLGDDADVETVQETPVIQPVIEPKPVVIPQQPTKPPEKTRLSKIEDILIEGFPKESFTQNPDLNKPKFKAVGETAAREIERELSKPKPSEDAIYHMIYRWLSHVPQTNINFIKNEALLLAVQLAKGAKKNLFGILLAQADLFPQQPSTYSFDSTTFTSSSLGILIISIVGGILGLTVLLFLIRFIVKGRATKKINAELTTLLLTVPKEQQLKEKAGDQTIEQIRAQIATMEQVFAVVGGLKADHGFHAWMFGSHDHMAFEIVNNGGLIYFYVTIPDKFRQLIEQQLQAQYPYIHLEEIPDYNLFRPKDIAAAAYLTLEKTHAYPLKTYQTLETDPLNGLLNPLSQLTETSGQAAIQYIIRPAHKHWRSASKKHIKEIQEGKKEGNALVGAISKTIELASTTDKNKPPKEAYRPSPLEEQLVKSIDEKAAKAGFECNIRIVTSASTEGTAATLLKTMVNSYSQYSTYQYGNSFKAHIKSNPNGIIDDVIFRRFKENQQAILNTQEMASLWHLPLSSTEVPNIKWLGSRKSAPPDNLPTEGVILGYNLYRNIKTEVRMKPNDRMRHMYVIGQTGTGKSTLLSNVAYQDILAGNGCCIMDPHGDLADALIGCIPPERVDDVIYFDPSDTSYPMGLNMLEFDPAYPEQKTFVINEMLKIFDKLYDLKSTGGPMFEQYVRNAMLLIMDDVPTGSTLMEISKVLADEDFRKMKLSKCTNPVVYDFWTKEAEKAGGEAALANMVPYITSKLTQFVSNDIMRPIIAQQESAFNFRQIMDQKKILLVNLAKGKIGDMNAKLLGMVIVGKILMAALSRTDTAEKDRVDFFLYIDEFQNFLTDSIATILSEARKYRLSLNIAHQYIGQLEEGGNEAVKNAIFGNIGTKAVFRISPDDAEFLEKEYAPVFNSFDLVNIEARTAYLKMLINNTAGRPFNIATYPPPKSDFELASALKELSKLTYGRSRELIEEEIRARSFVG